MKCTRCKKIYDYRRGIGATTKFCASCMVNRQRFKKKKRIVEKLGGKCKYCGYSKCLGALHTHHLNPKTKKFQLSGAHARSWKSIELELKKCILLCGNCHFELHHNCKEYKCASIV